MPVEWIVYNQHGIFYIRKLHIEPLCWLLIKVWWWWMIDWYHTMPMPRGEEETERIGGWHMVEIFRFFNSSVSFRLASASGIKRNERVWGFVVCGLWRHANFAVREMDLECVSTESWNWQWPHLYNITSLVIHNNFTSRCIPPICLQF